MAWDSFKMDSIRGVPGGLKICEYLLKNHGKPVPAPRSGQLTGVTITGLPVLMQFDDSKEYAKKIAAGEITLIPHYIVSLRAVWQLLDTDCCWRQPSGKDYDGTVCIAAVVSGIVGVPVIRNSVACRDTARLAAYVLKKNKLDVDAVSITRDCPEYITTRWKAFKTELRTQYKKV